MLVLLRQGRLSKWFSGIGQEAIATGVVTALEPDDYVLPMHRNLGVFTGRDLDLPRLFRQLLGREGGFTKGRDRTFHFGTLEKGIVGMISHLGAMLPVACGLALAAQLQGRAARGRGLHRRRGHERGRLPRGAQPRGGVEAAGAVRGREQPLGPLDAGPRAVRLPAPRRPRPRLRHAGRRRGRQRPARRPPGGAPRGRAGAARRRADAPRVQDLPHARPRGGLGHRLRAEGAARGVGEEGPGAALRGLPRREGPLHRGRLRRRSAPRTRRGSTRSPTRRSPRPSRARRSRRSWPTSSRRACSSRGRRRPRPRREAPELRYVDAISDGLRDGDAPGRPGRPPRPGHRRVRRRLQGDRGLRRGVRQGPRAQHADHRVGRDRLRARPRPRRPRPDGRDAVRRLHHLRLQPDRQQPGQDPLALGRAGAGRHPRARSAAARGPAPSTRRTSSRGSPRWPGSRSWPRRRPTTPRAC